MAKASRDSFTPNSSTVCAVTLLLKKLGNKRKLGSSLARNTRKSFRFNEFSDGHAMSYVRL